MNADATILRDIHGLDAIPWWPLAPGWWVVIMIAVLLLLALVARYWLTCRSGWLGWRADARRQLRALKKALRDGSAHAVARELSELLRRIAMVHSGREATAGLTGDEWLAWLATHDNTGFDWQRHGQLLLTAPYMPPTKPVERDELARLIRAALRWLKTSQPTATQGCRPRLFGVIRV